MQCNTWLRKIAAPFSLIATLFLVWSCSEGPAPGPMSPSANAGKRNLSAPSGASTSTVRPVKRLAKGASRSLAKAGYNVDKVERELQAVCDELEAIVNNRPGWSAEDKFNEVLREAKSALYSLQRVPADDRGALYRIDLAQYRLQEAINWRLLLPAQGAQFMAQFNTIERQIRYGINENGDYRGRSKSLWIKQSYGGMIKFAGHSIDVPKYATKQDAEYSINISPNDYITVDFGPDGWFDKQVTVTISYADADLNGIDPTKLTLAWYDEKAGQWIDLGGVVDLVNKTVTAKAWHFTQYTISTK